MISFLVALALMASGPTLGSSERAEPVYCSASGDLCFGIRGRGVTVVLTITTVERYFARYRLCVRPPRGATTCKSFPIRRSGRTYGSTVRWRAHFPNRGPGRYRVTWRLGANRLGPTLAFRLA